MKRAGAGFGGSLLTVADAGSAGNGYEMVGIPDGLGAIRHGDEYTIYMNHEVRDNTGIPRAHGQKRALVSQLQIDRDTLKVWGGKAFISPRIAPWRSRSMGRPTICRA